MKPHGSFTGADEVSDDFSIRSAERQTGLFQWCNLYLIQAFVHTMWKRQTQRHHAHCCRGPAQVGHSRLWQAQHAVKVVLVWPLCSAVLLLTLTVGTFCIFSTVKHKRLRELKLHQKEINPLSTFSFICYLYDVWQKGHSLWSNLIFVLITISIQKFWITFIFQHFNVLILCILSNKIVSQSQKVGTGIRYTFILSTNVCWKIIFICLIFGSLSGLLQGGFSFSA